MSTTTLARPAAPDPHGGTAAPQDETDRLVPAIDGTGSTRSLRLVRGDDRGISTAEYAVGTVAACGFAGVLWKLLSSDAVSDLLFELLKKALSFLF